MKILELEEKTGKMRIKVETQDDLWTLYNVIEEGDIFYAKTTREIKVGKNSTRKTMILGIKIKKMEFQPFTDRLRINGIIIYQPDKYQENGFKGNYHTINVNINDEITIMKEKWPNYLLKKIDEACKRTNIKICIIAIDDEEAAIGTIRNYGVELLAEIALRLPGKREATMREMKINKKLSEIAKTIKNIIKRRETETLIISGPNYIREKMRERIEEELKELRKRPKIIEENVVNGGVRGIHETLKKGTIIKALNNIQLIEENKLMEKLLEEMARETGKAVYGAKETEAAANNGAVETLMILDEELHAYGERRKKVEEIIKEVEKHGGKVKIFSLTNEAGKQLRSLGGIAALLRYKIT